MIIGLVSCYREGRLAGGAVASAAAAAELVLVYEGPVGGATSEGPPSELPRRESGRYVIVDGEWESDAAKRSAMLEHAQRLVERKRRGPRVDERAWGVWVDGDEILLWGQYLPDHAARAEHETGAGGFPLRIVELDGSAALCMGKVIDLDAVSGYLVSSYQVRLSSSGMVVALPNVKICRAGGWPFGEAPTDELELEAFLARHRLPLPGEPHLLHRSVLRAPTRGVSRLHNAEADWFTDALEAQGLGGISDAN